MINYYSTEGTADIVSFEDALMAGLAPDRGLYMPERIATLPDSLYSSTTFAECAYAAAEAQVDGAIPSDDLKNICREAFNFPVPVTRLHDSIYHMELFHGPTAAFKDFGARFMARCMSYFIGKKSSRITILVATSGDTGSAVARGFYKVDGIDVVILYPSGKVSHLQEKQLTTLGENITALEVQGTFDDCQHMVKEAFIDQELLKTMQLSSANSINIGRLLPQSFYYNWAYLQVQQKKSDPVIFCTPSGNFGNLTAGLLAHKMGLPVEKFIAATNINDVVPEYLETGVFTPRPSKHTYSNAMDVGNPSNFSRMQALYGSREAMNNKIEGYNTTDAETIATIRSVYDRIGYILDPHSAVGYNAIQMFYKKHGECDTPIILLETAHPAKFHDTIHNAIDRDIEIPDVLREAMAKEKHSIVIENNLPALKEFLLNR
jgi:threonine synthase